MQSDLKPKIHFSLPKNYNIESILINISKLNQNIKQTFIYVKTKCTCIYILADIFVYNFISICYHYR